MAAARAWAAGNLVAAPAHIAEPEAIADARRWGATPEEIAGLRAMLSGPEAFGVAVWRDNVAAVEAFLCVATQWRTSLAIGERGLRTLWIGLDYAGAKASIDASGITLTPGLWTDLRLLELAARDALNGETVH